MFIYDRVENAELLAPSTSAHQQSTLKPERVSSKIKDQENNSLHKASKLEKHLSKNQLGDVTCPSV